MPSAYVPPMTPMPQVTLADAPYYLWDFLPGKTRPKRADMKRVPTSMFFDLYGQGRLDVMRGKQAMERQVPRAYYVATRGVGFRESEKPFFDRIGFEAHLDTRYLAQGQHWSTKPDLFRIMQRQHMDLTYPNWEELEATLSQLYMRPSLLVDNITGHQPYALYALQLWANIRRLAARLDEPYVNYAW